MTWRLSTYPARLQEAMVFYKKHNVMTPKPLSSSLMIVMPVRAGISLKALTLPISDSGMRWILDASVCRF